MLGDALKGSFKGRRHRGILWRETIPVGAGHEEIAAGATRIKGTAGNRKKKHEERKTDMKSHGLSSPAT